MFGLRAKQESTDAPGDGFSSGSRRRLDRFADLFDDVAAEDLVLFAGPASPDAALSAAMSSADRVLGAGGERAATKRAIQSFVKAAEVRYVEEFGVTKLLGIGAKQTSSAADRVRVFQSLERAVVALVLWDRLGPDEQSALAGPWRELVERAVEDA